MRLLCDSSDLRNEPSVAMKIVPDTSATLVFPAVNQAAVDYLNAARHRHEITICASSVTNDLIRAELGDIHFLPFIHEEDFPQQFLSLVAARSICRLFCPISTVHVFMRRFIAAHRLEIELIGDSPVRQQVLQHYQLMSRARRLMPLVELCADGHACSLVELAGVLRQLSLIYGESNDDKLAAMMGIFARSTVGDVVEIGSLMGRSAFVLLYLAWRHNIGQVLTIDPWRADTCVQHDSPDALEGVADEWDFNVLSEGFYVNMVPFRTDDHAHLRMSSEDALKVYDAGDPILSWRGRRIAFSGKISVIHIDGNHDYDCVRRDWGLWSDKLLPGAWLVLDDYIWAHGDGPYLIGNELLREEWKRIECAFVCGKALFVKFMR